MLLAEFDREANAVINPDMVTERIENFPAVTISCFSKKLFDRVLAAFEAKKLTDIHSAVGLNPVYEVEYKGKRFAQRSSARVPQAKPRTVRSAKSKNY